jgi:hypothetical protein
VARIVLCPGTTSRIPNDITSAGREQFSGKLPEKIAMKWSRLGILGAATACATATPPNKPVATSFAAPNTSVASYQTFSFGLADQPKAGYVVTPRSLEVQRRLRPVVLEALQEHGYVENDTNAELIVKLAAGTGTIPNPAAERAVPGGPALGFIGIHIYDARAGTEVWQGSAFAEIDPAKIDDSLLKMGVEHMLADFPTRKPAPVAKAPSSARKN